MKKAIALLLFAGIGLGVVRQASAIDVPNGVPPAIGAKGGNLNSGSMLQMSSVPGGRVVMGPVLTAAVNLTQYDAVILVAGKKVSKTATVGDVNFYGIVQETTAFGSPVQVARFGTTYARVSMSATVGDRLVMAAGPGYLTGTGAATAALYSSVSGTPVVARALDTYTYTCGTCTPLLLISIGDKL